MSIRLARSREATKVIILTFDYVKPNAVVIDCVADVQYSPLQIFSFLTQVPEFHSSEIHPLS